MASSIPWFIYMIIGGIVTLISYFVNPVELIVFLYAGILMFLWGLLKWLFSLLQSKESVREHILSGSHVLRCDSCGVTLHALFNYCPKCGKKHK